jgi:hypothetical protein
MRKLLFASFLCVVSLSAPAQTKSAKAELPELTVWNLEQVDDIYDESENGIVVTNGFSHDCVSAFLRVDSMYSLVIAPQGEKKPAVISLGTIDKAVPALENLVSSYKSGRTLKIDGYTLKGVRNNTYRILPEGRFEGIGSTGKYLIDIPSMEFGMTVLSHINRMASMETLVRSGDYDAEFKTMRVTPSGTIKTKTVRNTNSPIEVHGLRNPR